MVWRTKSLEPSLKANQGRYDYIIKFHETVPFSKQLKNIVSRKTKSEQDLEDYCFQELLKLRALILFLCIPRNILLVR